MFSVLPTIIVALMMSVSSMSPDVQNIPPTDPPPEITITDFQYYDPPGDLTIDHVTFVEITDVDGLPALFVKDAKDGFDGVSYEYAYLDSQFGLQGIEFEFIMQELIEKDQVLYDHLTVELPDGTVYKVIFDISDFFGKF